MHRRVAGGVRRTDHAHGPSRPEVGPVRLQPAEAVGVVYSPLTDKWRLAPGDLDVNYMMRFDKY